MNKSLLKKFVIPAALTVTALILLDAYFLEKYFFEIKKFRIGRINSSGRPIRLLQLSDLHLKDHLTYNYIRLAKTVRRLQPDLILITGDAIDTHGSIDILQSFLDLLDTDTPKAAILGNHEYSADIDIKELKKLYEQYNCNLLINESKAYQIRGERVMVTGLDDLLNGENDIQKAFKEVKAEKNHLVLIHSPQHQESLKEVLADINGSRRSEDRINVQYLFAGHNHGGQITLAGQIVPYLPDKSGNYLKGWYNQAPPYLYLSKGFGTSTVPFRFGARAEITSFLYNT
ncbi:metallophosphoesterase [Telluribacter humicola]|uniref:metallophosphoesterase n=1 Tax=Telluribacter humicola TaxID=1720261 RepID=UPI001A96FB8F|nr:metallophosphoesterase [Telluribacter humicola]